MVSEEELNERKELEPRTVISNRKGCGATVIKGGRTYKIEEIGQGHHQGNKNGSLPSRSCVRGVDLRQKKGYLSHALGIKVAPEKRNQNKYCQYHGGHGHDTEECIHLKNDIEKLIQRGQTLCQPTIPS